MSKDENFKVDFIGIGAPKSGSTWLGECLRQHPEIDFSNTKETHFFLTQPYIIDRDKYESLEKTKMLRCKTFTEYKNEFKNDGRVKGEFSPAYLYDDRTPQLIKKHNPDIKLIVSLRNPVDLIYSWFWYVKSWRFLEDNSISFEQYMKQNPKVVELGLFYKHLSQYFEIFNSQQIHVILFDDIKHNPEIVLENLFSYLGVDSTFRPSFLGKKVYGTKTVRYPWLSNLATYSVRFLRKIGLENFVYKHMNLQSRLAFWYQKLNQKKFSYPPLSPKEFNKYHEIFNQDIFKLQEIVLSSHIAKWTKKDASQ